jgi:hypothetical protein
MKGEKRRKKKILKLAHKTFNSRPKIYLLRFPFEEEVNFFWQKKAFNFVSSFSLSTQHHHGSSTLLPSYKFSFFVLFFIMSLEAIVCGFRLDRILVENKIQNHLWFHFNDEYKNFSEWRKKSIV